MAGDTTPTIGGGYSPVIKQMVDRQTNTISKGKSSIVVSPIELCSCIERTMQI